MMNKISKKSLEEIGLNQKSIGIMLAVIVCVSALFWFLLYAPKKENLIKAKREYEKIEKQISDIQAKTKGKPMEEAISMFVNQLKEYDQELLVDERIAVKDIIAYTEQFHIKVPSFTPGQIKPSAIQEDIPGYRCEEMPVNLTLECTYKDLGNYLQCLHGDFPASVRIDDVSMVKASKEEAAGQAKLKAELRITIFMLKPVD